MEPTRQDIDAVTEQLKAELQGIAENAHERAWSIEEHGLNIGDKGQTLYTGGAGDWEAPRLHPVWAPEVEREARRLEAMGAATFEYKPTYDKLQEWADAGKPAVGSWAIDREHEGWQAQQANVEAPMPERGTNAYVQRVVQDAMQTGIDEGYPLRPEQIRTIEAKVRMQEGLATPAQAVAAQAAALRAEGKGIETHAHGKEHGRGR